MTPNDTKSTPTVRAPDAERGSVLLEALIGILIFSMGILAIIGLQAASTKFATDAKYRSDASYIANQTLAKMWVDTANITSYVATNQPISDLPSGTRSIAVTPDGAQGYVVTITITWVTPGTTGPMTGSVAAPHKYVSVTEIHNRCDNGTCA